MVERVHVFDGGGDFAGGVPGGAVFGVSDLGAGGGSVWAEAGAAGEFFVAHGELVVLDIFVAGDQIRKGAATNAVQIAEKMI